MDRAFRRNTIAVIISAAVLVLCGLYYIVLAEKSMTANPFLTILFLVPLLAVALFAGGGGWTGAAVSNLKLRPDIGVGWLFAVPEFKRLSKIGIIYSYIFAAFLVVRATQWQGTTAQRDDWMTYTGVVYLAASLVQIGIHLSLNKSAFQAARARLSTPMPMAMPAPVAPVSAE